MGKRVFVGLLMVAAMFAVISPAGTDAKSVPTCQGKKATQWLTSPGELLFTSGDDVLVGSSGPDVLAEGDSGGTDLVCGNGGNDEIVISGPGSAAYGGTGDDEITAFAGASAYGESGNDIISLNSDGTYGDGGADNDAIIFTGNSTANGGSGDDQIQGSDIDGGDVFGGPGIDSLYLTGEFGTIDCGQNNDVLSLIGFADIIKRCESMIGPVS